MKPDDYAGLLRVPSTRCRFDHEATRQARYLQVTLQRALMAGRHFARAERLRGLVPLGRSVEKRAELLAAFEHELREYARHHVWAVSTAEGLERFLLDVDDRRARDEEDRARLAEPTPDVDAFPSAWEARPR